MDLSHQRATFIGTGQMAAALASGFVRTLLRPSQISGYDPAEPARRQFQQTTGADCVVTEHLADAVSEATVVILAVKPQVMPEVLRNLAPLLTNSPLVISVAAGITLARMSAALPAGTRLIRVMPNTPALIGRGASAAAAGDTCTPEDVQVAQTLLSTVGLIQWVGEPLLDAVTGLSGSGPAYAFQIIEALSDGGVKMGLPRVVATRLAAQTLLGAAEMVLTLNQHPAALKDAVASPGGTTIAGLHALEQGGLRAALMNAVEAAALRSKQLGQ
ncbi:MAG: pyrroline-5-carboxylate reductase [Planctomyces sp.]|jgi:pyrroline-5-carboxylate reductase|nr:pyrroline-5-carboxylate reductase [Planctomyces sp.]